MRGKAVQGLIILAVAIGLGIVVANTADGWADWVVFGVIIVTTLGFAIAVAPNIYARRRRTISRQGGSPPPGRRVDRG